MYSLFPPTPTAVAALVGFGVCVFVCLFFSTRYLKNRRS